MVNMQLLEQVIKSLNGDIANEYSAVIQYTQHAAMLHGPEYFAVIDELEKHAKEELDHAITLSDMVQYLGGVPTLEVAQRLTSESNQEMLLQDLQGEYHAIRSYNERIAQLETLGLFDLSHQLREIAAEEQEHANDLEIALGIDRKRPTIPQFETVYPQAPGNPVNFDRYLNQTKNSFKN